MNKAQPRTILSDYDITLMQGGTHCRLYQKMGSHPAEQDGKQGISFAVYAPAAKRVSVIGDFNRWMAGVHDLYPKWDSSGVWEGFIPDLQPGSLYKYAIESHNGWNASTPPSVDEVATFGERSPLSNHQLSKCFVKADPYGRMHEHPPMTATIIWKDEYTWNDEQWMNSRGERNKIGAPVSTYEMHLASWRRHGDGRPYTYRELADALPAYLSEMGFTHVEFMPVMEHPYDPSWGYQITGFFAPTCRFGTPDDLRYLIDRLHQHQIGVILDWVPSHFPSDAHGLGYFDGSHVYEHPDTRKGYHPDWQSLIFNYGRNEVKSFLLSNALFWIDEFHADGLRVDAVASMIYLDYSRKEGEWEPNHFGGRENLEAIDFLKAMNEMVYHYHPDILTIAEESTAFPGVSHPTYAGGLGFGMKWMMGWMHDTLKYFGQDPLYRKHYHNQITFSMIYNYSENYVLPLSHDEVVYGKGSLLSRMPGEGQDQFAHLRLMIGHMYTHPGAKLLFMGGEFGQRSEWNFASQLEWNVLAFESHAGIKAWVKAMNELYQHQPALHELCTKPEGFRWVRMDDWQQSVLAYKRIGTKPDDRLLVVLNLTPVVRDQYRIGTEEEGSWALIDHSDKAKYWGKEGHVHDNVKIENTQWDHRSKSMEFSLPGLTMVIYRWIPAKKKSDAVASAKKLRQLKEAKVMEQVEAQRRSRTLRGKAAGELRAESREKIETKTSKPANLSKPCFNSG